MQIHPKNREVRAHTQLQPAPHLVTLSHVWGGGVGAIGGYLAVGLDWFMTRDDNKSSQQWFGGCALYRTVTGTCTWVFHKSGWGEDPADPVSREAGIEWTECRSERCGLL